MWPDYKCIIHMHVPGQVDKAVMHMVSAHGTVCIFIYILPIQLTQWTVLNFTGPWIFYFSHASPLKVYTTPTSWNWAFAFAAYQKDQYILPFQTDVRMTLTLLWNLSQVQW
jgi:hypothetical protein